MFDLIAVNDAHSDDTISGSDIAGLYAAGDWAGIKSHVLSDIRLTRALAERLGHWRGGRS